jgi:hypothetical protein
MDYDAIRTRWAGAVLNDNKDTILDALKARLDYLVEDVRIHRWDHFLKGDWRGDLHRRKQAAAIRATRNALRDVQRLPMRVAA